MQLEPRRLVPAATLQRVAGGHGGEAIGGGEVGRVHALDGADLLDQTAGGGVLTELQMRVDHVVHRVHRVVRAQRVGRGLELRFRGPRRCGVGCDRVLPHAQPREDVRRHVQRVRRRWGDRGVTPRRRQPLLHQLGVVVRVNQVVRGAGVIGTRLEEGLEDAAGLELFGEGLVRGERVRDQGQRVEDLRFIVFADSVAQPAPWPAPRRARAAGGRSCPNPGRAWPAPRCSHARAGCVRRS